MDNFLESNLTELYELSQEKLALMKEILQITREQESCIAEDKLDTLGKTINDKQLRIDRIDELDKEFNNIFSNIKDKYRVESIDQLEDYDKVHVQKLQDCIAEIMSTIKEIIDIEKVNNDKVKTLKEKMAVNIKKVNQSKLINSAYSNAKAIQPSRFYDNKG